VEPARDFAQLPLQFVDQIPWRDELIRPLVLFAEGTPPQRAEDTPTPPDTVRTCLRRFRQEGMLGLLPTDIEGAPRPRASRVPEAVRQAMARLQALHNDLQYREIVRIIFYKCGYRLHPKTAKRRWQQGQPAIQEALALGDSHSQGDRYQARVHVIKLSSQGWPKRSLSRVCHVSRPPIDRWMHRFAAEHFAGLVDKSFAPKAPARKVWLPRMLEVYHRQKRHPDAGECRIWSLLGNSEISVRTVGRLMALHRQVYDAIPHRPTQDAPKDPRPHPYRATAPPEFWFIDGRNMDFAIAGVTWWSRIILDGSSRTMLAGAVAPTEASWVALMVLSTACLRYGAPQALLSDSGGAFPSNEFEALCTRLQIDHKPMESTKGESSLHWMETHVNVPRRLYDYQCSLSTTPLECEQAPQACMELYTTTAHQGLLTDRCAPPLPLVV